VSRNTVKRYLGKGGWVAYRSPQRGARLEGLEDWLKELGRRTRDPEATMTPVEEAGEEVLRGAAEWLVPVEGVSPPLPVDRLGSVDGLIARLCDAGAKGTGEALRYAFGLQLDPRCRPPTPIP
jgi:hypothetical protein